MKKHIQSGFLAKKERGQSLVEVALFFPIFLIILAGLVEVGNLVITSNKVHNAARVGSRFGSNGGQDEGMSLSALNAVTDTLILDENVWDMWAVRGTVNAAGDGFANWQFNHVYGLQTTRRFSDVVESDVQQEVLEQLQTDQDGNTPAGIAGGLQFVGLYLIHDIDSILGLNAMPALAGINSVKSLSVMRDLGLQIVTNDACTAFPIAVRDDIRSVLSPGTGGTAENRWPDVFAYSNPDPLVYNSFFNHVPNEPLEFAREGYLYKIQNGSTPGTKGWLVWNECISPSAGVLADSLTWPGDSNDYTTPVGGVCPSRPTVPKFKGFEEAGDPTDRSMHIGDWISTNTGNVNSSAVRNILQEHIDLGRNLRVIVYDHENVQESGSNASYLIKDFAIFRLWGYKLDSGGDGSWIMGEFIRWDSSCGQP